MLLLVLAFLTFLPAAWADGGVVAVLVSPNRVERRDAATGRFLGYLSVNNVERVSSDGTIIAVQQTNGTVSRYEAKSGRFLGNLSVNPKNIEGLQVTSGVIVITQDRRMRRYDAQTGRFLGSN